MNFTRIDENDDGISTVLGFYAEKLPTLDKKISYYYPKDQFGEKGKLIPNAVAQQFDENTVLQFGDGIIYDFVVTEYGNISDSGGKLLDYQEPIRLHDDLIGFDVNIPENVLVGEDTKDERTGTYLRTSETKGNEQITTYRTVYKINADDLESGLYKNGVFKNTAQLDYSYSSRYSSGTFDSSDTGEVDAKLAGFVVYEWDPSLPDVVKAKVLPESSYPGFENNVTVADATEKTVVIVDNVTNTTTTYTFSHWESDDITGTNRHYHAGDTFNMPDSKSVHLIGHWRSETVNNTADLTITKTGVADIDENQSFVFYGRGVDDTATEGIDLKVVINKNDNWSVTIKDLPVGQYTVTEDENWSWRYDAADATKTVTIPTDDVVSFANTRTETKWLNGSAWCDNRWNGSNGNVTQTHDDDRKGAN